MTERRIRQCAQDVVDAVDDYKDDLSVLMTGVTLAVAGLLDAVSAASNTSIKDTRALFLSGLDDVLNDGERLN